MSRKTVYRAIEGIDRKQLEAFQAGMRKRYSDEYILEELKDSLCLGISLITGPMIKETVEIARSIKKWNKQFPIILGGWHPSLLPGQTLEAEYVDIVTRGQGEDGMLEVAERLSDGAPLDDVRGIGFKRDDAPYFTPERPLKSLEEMPPKAYHLADFDAYERICGRRWAMYTSSLACPFNCAYCTNAGVYGRKWNALPVEQVVEETIDLTRRHRLELLWLADDNFLVDIDRALRIAEGLVRGGDHEPDGTPDCGRTRLAATLRASPDLSGH